MRASEDRKSGVDGGDTAVEEPGLAVQLRRTYIMLGQVHSSSKSRTAGRKVGDGELGVRSVLRG